MTARIPLVLNSGAFQELQSGDSFNLGSGASLTSPTIATSMTLSYGTANQVQYLNGSKQLVGDADLTFDGTTLSVAAINATTVDLTNLEVTNLKAQDGTAAITLADSTGVATLSANPILNAGTANGVAYLNGSKVLTTGSALTFDGITLGINSGSLATVDINASDATSTSYLRLQDYGVTRAWLASYRDGSGKTELLGNVFLTFALGAGVTEQMRLTSAGLGIGTSSPSEKLHVAGGLLSTSGNNSADVVDGAILDYSAGDTRLIASRSGATNANMLFYTTASGTLAERMRIDSSGNLLVGVTSATSGGGVIQVSNGITFPATQSASSDANTLDDYEEGTWTPTMTISSSGAGITYGIQGGTYTKTGNIVTLRGSLLLTSKGSNSGDVYIQGLPFQALAYGYQHSTGSIIFWNKASTASFVTLVNGLEIQFRSSVSTGDVNLTNSDINNDTSISFTVVYTAA